VSTVLDVITGRAAGRSIAVPGAGLVLGRESATIEGRLGDDPAISRRHAELFELDGDLVIRDCDSSNGTYVNGRRITQAVRLTTGDTIGVGDSMLEVRNGDVLEQTQIGAAWPGAGAPPRHQETAQPSVALGGDARVQATRGGFANVGPISGGVDIRNRYQVGETISGAHGFPKFLIGLGISCSVVGAALFGYPIIKFMVDVGKAMNSPTEPKHTPTPFELPWSAVGIVLALIGSTLIIFGIFLKREE
jgi:pSer/pThr/pTyr-binding forkhead associated (FHA) protein